MRVDSPSVNSLGGSGSSSSVHQIGRDSSTGSGQLEDGAGDVVKLSSATGLVALAQTAGLNDRKPKVDGIAAQVRSGQYQAQTPDVSNAMIKELVGG